MKGVRKVAGADTHFRIHDEREFHIGFKETARRVLSARVMCEGRGVNYHYVPKGQTAALREAASVTCVHCSIIKDAWLATTDLRPLTLRRLRALKDRMKEGGAS